MMGAIAEPWLMVLLRLVLRMRGRVESDTGVKKGVARVTACCC